jgi:hypothetical protein
MESHDELIKPILRQLITWTSSEEGITLLELFGGIGTSFEALLTIKDGGSKVFLHRH